MSVILALDCATQACSIALWADAKQDEWFDVVPRQHSDLILPKIDRLLSKAAIELSDIDAIAFSAGPGSFMGVRLATGVAQGLAFAVDCLLIPVSTLQALAQTTHQAVKAEHILAGWDARMGEIYWGAYQVDEQGIMQAVIEDSVMNPADIQLIATGPWCAAGNAWAVYQDQLPLDLVKQFSEVKSDIYPRASAVAQIAVKQLRQGKGLPADQVEPVYLRNKVIS